MSRLKRLFAFTAVAFAFTLGAAAPASADIHATGTTSSEDLRPGN